MIADDDNLDTARDLGFAGIPRDNDFVSRKFNDGIMLACDPRYNPRPADYVVPCGSDDWVHPALFTDLPAEHMVAFQRMSFVREDGLELTVRKVGNEGGCGIRIYPRKMLEQAGYRPADEARKRACDTSILVNLKRLGPVQIEHRDLDPLHIVDWKTTDANLNSYKHVSARHRAELARDPFDILAGRYPQPALDEMRGYYAKQRGLSLAAA